MKRRKQRRKEVGEKEGEEESGTSILVEDESDAEAELWEALVMDEQNGSEWECTSTSPESRTVTRNDFKDRRLASRINAVVLAYFLLTHTLLENFPGGLLFLYFSTTSTLNYGVLKNGFSKKKMHF